MNFWVLVRRELGNLLRNKVIYFSLFFGMMYGAIVIGLGITAPVSELRAMVPTMGYADATSMVIVLSTIILFFERKEQVSRAVLMTPTSAHEVVLSKVFTLVIVALISTTIISITSFVFLHDQNFNFIWLIIGSILSALMCAPIGMIVAYRSKDFMDSLMKGAIVILVLLIPSLVLVNSSSMHDNPVTDVIAVILPTSHIYNIMMNSIGESTMNIWISIPYLFITGIVACYFAIKLYVQFVLKGDGS